MPITAFASAAEMRLLAGYAAEDQRELEATGKVEIDSFSPEHKHLVLASTAGVYSDNVCLCSMTCRIYIMLHFFSLSLGGDKANKVLLFFSQFDFGCSLRCAVADAEANKLTLNYTNAKVSASNIMPLIVREPIIDNLSVEGESPISDQNCIPPT